MRALRLTVGRWSLAISAMASAICFGMQTLNVTFFSSGGSDILSVVMVLV